MAWIIITVAGVWITLCAFILLMVCMNSSRLSQIEEPVKRTPRLRDYPKVGIPNVQSSAASISGD